MKKGGRSPRPRQLLVAQGEVNPGDDELLDSVNLLVQGAGTQLAALRHRASGWRPGSLQELAVPRADKVMRVHKAGRGERDLRHCEGLTNKHSHCASVGEFA